MTDYGITYLFHDRRVRSECVTNFEVRRRTGQPLLSDTVRIRRLKLFGHVARADKSQDHSRALQACISPAPRNWRRRPGQQQRQLGVLFMN